MATTIPLRPVTTVQPGLWTVVGAATADVALSDNLDTSYVQLVQKCRLDNQVIRLGFGTPAIPAGAQIISVGARRRIQTVVPPAPQPHCVHWFRCPGGGLIGLVTAIIVEILRWIFGSRCPQQPTVVWVEEDLGTFTTDPNGNPWTLASFNPFTYDMGRDDDNTNPLRVSEVYIDVTYQQQASISVTAPTGTITNTCRPTVTWTYTSPDSEPQYAHRTAIYTAAQVGAVGFEPFVTTPLQDSGWLLGEDLSWTLSADITNGTYYAYVQVQQTWAGAGTFLSGIASTSWTQSIAGSPDAVLQSCTFDPIFNRIALTFAPSASSPTTAAFAVTARRSPGGPWVPVRTGLFIAATGMTPITIYDYEAPANTLSEYRVLAYGQTGSLFFAAADYSNVLSATPVVEDWWLKDPLNPLLNTILPVAYQGDSVTRRRVQGTFEPISGSTSVQKIVVDGPQYGIEGTLSLIFHENQPVGIAGPLYFAFEQIDAANHTLLLQYPTGEQHYIVLGPGAVGSDETYQWEMSKGPDRVKYRTLQVSYTEVDEPPITS